MEIIEKKNNPLLKRVEVLAKLVFESVTPSNADVRSQLAKKLKVEPELVVVNQIKTVFGSRQAFVKAYAYEDVASKNVAVKQKKQKEKKNG